MKKLNIGCGKDLKKDFINLDVKKEFGTSKNEELYFLVADIAEGLPFKNETFDYILAQDILEHFNKYMVHLIFLEIARVLKIKGEIFIRVPDFEIILNEICQKKMNIFDSLDLIYGESLIASNVYTGDFGIHKWGFSKRSLKIFARKFGIEFLEVKNIGFNIEAFGEKKEHVKFIDNIKITSWGNRVGIGRPYVTIKEFKELLNNEN